MKSIFKFILNFLQVISLIRFSPGWILKRLYVAGIYLPSDFSASYIGFENKKIKIVGGLRSDFEKYVIKELWNDICIAMKKRKIVNLFLKPLIANTGADLHYSGTLIDYTDKDGKINYKGNKTNIMVLDSSSSDILPVPNPTFYFIARAIKLLRNF